MQQASGMLTTVSAIGLEFARNYRPTDDELTIRRLREAGAPTG
jgi:hypothetical protein